MKTLVVYDSVFGNTEKVALAIGESLGARGNVETCRVSDMKPAKLDGLGLLIVGSPTRAFRPTKAIASFLNAIPPNGLKGVKVSAFDTRIATENAHSRILNVMVRVFGYAAQPIADKLAKRGGALAMPPEGFFVKDSEGPLKEGELERAAKWAHGAMKAQ